MINRYKSIWSLAILGIKCIQNLTKVDVVGVQWNSERSVGMRWEEIIWFAFWVGWKASQNTYLLASGHEIECSLQR